MNNKEIKLAVLIDADNISHSYIKGILEEIAKYGTPTIKRIYADWTKPTVNAWKNVLLENAVTPVQQYSYTTGKNATDSAMIIEAMDILYSDKVDGFVIASSDSDFTRLATRLREAGMKVYGMGEKKTPSPFRVACDKFIYLEITETKKGSKQINPQTENQSETITVPGTKTNQGTKTQKENIQTKDSRSGILKIEESVINLIASSIDDETSEDGWAYLSDVGNLISRKQPDFDSRNFGFDKLSRLIETMKQFEVVRRETSTPGVKHVYVRNK